MPIRLIATLALALSLSGCGVIGTTVGVVTAVGSTAVGVATSVGSGVVGVATAPF